MVTFTHTAQLSSLAVPAPTPAVLEFPRANKSNSSETGTEGLTTARIPPGSQFSTGRHWHNDYTEYIKVLQGAMLVTRGNQSWVITPESAMVGRPGGRFDEDEDASIVFPIKYRHEIMRWDRKGLRGHQKRAQDEFIAQVRRDHADSVAAEQRLEQLREEEVVGYEWTAPRDGMKEVFFRQMVSVVAEQRSGLGLLITLCHVFLIFDGLDAPPVLLDLGSECGQGWTGWAEAVVSSVATGLATVLGHWLLGLDTVTRNYTPERLAKVWGPKANVGGKKGQ